MTTKIKSQIRPRIDPKLNISEPPSFRVIYINDETTTQEFVVETLKLIFHYDQGGAEAITAKVHAEGSAVVAVLPHEIAEQKIKDATDLARSHGYPLVLKAEAELALKN